MRESVQATVFGKRREHHTIIIARGDSVRHFTVRPWMSAFVGSVVAAAAIGYLLATTYLVLRDDLLGAAVARQARMQHAYEDRISALRAQVDRITSRQLLDQRLMEDKVAELLDRQTVLSQRHGRLAPILERAEPSDATAVRVPTPSAKPEQRAGLGSGTFLQAFAAADASPAWDDAFFGSDRDAARDEETPADRADKLFTSIHRSLRSIETEQMAKMGTLAEDAYRTADAISTTLASAGLPVEAPAVHGTGGPLIPIGEAAMFEAKVQELDQALGALQAMRGIAMKLPIGNPVPGSAISSAFGMRTDPILGAPALHSGLDFRAGTGVAAKSTGAGVVAKAGWNGGYGQMVEIDHADGFSTRYAHLSRILVTVGQRVETQDAVGEVGSSGRSTGPHLHYEIRRYGDAVNPATFLKAGKKIGPFL